MNIREEQCNKVCRILDDVLANRTTERDSLIVAVRKAFESLEQFGNSEPLPSAQPEQRYTEEELRVFAHGISLSLLSKRSAQHWRYDEDTATEIKFLERLYDKVVADMGDEQDG